MAGFFEVKVQVDAPPEYLWKVLIDFEKYPEWNPFITKIDGEAKIGSSITLHVKLNPNLESIRFSKEMIVSLKENQHLSYDSHFMSSSLFNAVRWQTIRPTDDGKQSIYHSHQKISGIASWPICRAFGDSICDGFQESSLALKKRVEKLYREEKSD
jgi:hypothetical protein